MSVFLSTLPKLGLGEFVLSVWSLIYETVHWKHTKSGHVHKS